MDLGHFIKPGNFLPDMRAIDRWEAIDELIDNLVVTGRLKPENRDAIAAAVKKRETAMSTGIGFGIGVPHASTDLVGEVVGALGRSKMGINFDALDNLPVNLVMLFLVPQGQFQEHLDTLANIAKLLHTADFRNSLDAHIRDLMPPALPHRQIEQRLQQAIRAVLPDADLAAVLVRPCPDAKFGDYQTAALMALAKPRKLNPRQLAGEVLAKLDVSDVCEPVEIAGAGFLNFRLKNSALVAALAAAARGEHLFFEKTTQPRTVVMDFSSPNVAKPMHVGHIRSTILGDCLARVLRLLGHRVITDNHIGDWGTQFGYILLVWKNFQLKAPAALRRCLDDDPIKTMGEFYRMGQVAETLGPTEDTIRNCKDLEDADWVTANPAERTELAKAEVVKLQSGDPETLAIWREMITLSQKQFDEIYTRLGVKFDNTLGESFYNPKLKPLVGELLAKGIARESEGALAVFFDDIAQLKKQPALVRKSDGGFNYTTTDLATLAHRLATWSPDEIIYVTDGRQQLHFQQVFAAFQKWQLAIGHQQAAMPRLAHVWFGSILGEDGKPFKTRSGETVKLADLLDEAEERAFKVVSEKNPKLAESARREVARVVGLGAVKYADLLPNRQSDYVFSWDKMLALNGNTAPYLQYAYARIRSIFRKGEIEHSTFNPQRSTLNLSAPEEIALARQLLNFGLVLEAAAAEYRPNFICNYLYDLAGLFARFYESCPVLKADEVSRASRLVLCDLTARGLKQGLEVLGIGTLEQM